jgi:hypothetical protein
VLQNLTSALNNGKWASGCEFLQSRPLHLLAEIPLQNHCAHAPFAVFNPDLEAGPLTEVPFGPNMVFSEVRA